MSSCDDDCQGDVEEVEGPAKKPKDNLHCRGDATEAPQLIPAASPDGQGTMRTAEANPSPAQQVDTPQHMGTMEVTQDPPPQQMAPGTTNPDEASQATEENEMEQGRSRPQNRAARQPTVAFNKFIIPHYDMVKNLEATMPSIKLSCDITLRGEIVAKPRDEDTYDRLKAMAAENPRIRELLAQEKMHKGVVLHVPVPIPAERFLDATNIVKAERLTTGTNKIPTRNMLIHHRGPLPSHIALGVWGRFKIRPYVEGPLQCYNCQGFNHIAATCQHVKKCGVCSKQHDSKDCIALLKQPAPETPRPEPKCANCGKKHHAWNQGCPVMVQRWQQVRQRMAPVATAQPNSVNTQQQQVGTSTNAPSPRPNPWNYHHRPIAAASTGPSAAATPYSREFPALGEQQRRPVAPQGEQRHGQVSKPQQKRNKGTQQARLRDAAQGAAATQHQTGHQQGTSRPSQSPPECSRKQAAAPSQMAQRTTETCATCGSAAATIAGVGQQPQAAAKEALSPQREGTSQVHIVTVIKLVVEVLSMLLPSMKDRQVCKELLTTVYSMALLERVDSAALKDHLTQVFTPEEMVEHARMFRRTMAEQEEMESDGSPGSP